MFYNVVIKSQSPLEIGFVPVKKPIAPAIIAGAAVLGSAILGGIFSNSTSEKSLAATRETNEANKQIAVMNNQANLDLYREQFRNSQEVWQQENAYNSPAAQASRLRAAGLNPALAFGGVNTSNSVSLPSAAPMEAAYEQSAPYEAYSDSMLGSLADSLPNIAKSLSDWEDYKQKHVDNQTRKEMNKFAIKQQLAQIDNTLANSEQLKKSGAVSDAEIQKMLAEKQSLEFALRLNEATYKDQSEVTKLSNDYLRAQRQALEDSNARDKERLVLEKLQTRSNVRLTDAQAASVQGMLTLARNADKREFSKHNMEQTLRAWDKQLKILNVSRAEKENLFLDIIEGSEMEHTLLKDKSLLNKMVEESFGLGFRDIGAALRNLLSK